MQLLATAAVEPPPPLPALAAVPTAIATAVPDSSSRRQRPNQLYREHVKMRLTQFRT